MSIESQYAVLVALDNGSNITWIGWAEDANQATTDAMDWCQSMISRTQVQDALVLPDSFLLPVPRY